MRVKDLDYHSIAYAKAGKFEDTRFEKTHNVIFDSSAEASVLVAQEIAALIRAKEDSNQSCVLGLATGSSPIKVYEELGFEIIKCSAETGDGIDTLLDKIAGSTCVFLGTSGVGKSSLLNSIDSSLNLKTSENSFLRRNRRRTSKFRVRHFFAPPCT